MAGYLTTYGANAILSGTAMPTTLYLQGHVAEPGVDADQAEAFETRRLEVTLTAPAAGAAENAGPSSFSLAAATEEWTHVSIWDAASAGNPWWVVELGSPLNITEDDTVRIEAGLLDLSFELWS